jgi:Flp pilus assembly pilin Flp
MHLPNLLGQCLREEHGSEAVEYALLLGLIVLGAIVVMSALGVKVVDKWRQIVDAI